VVSDNGYLHGTAAPGHRNLFEAPLATHNLMRAHGTAVQAYRSSGRHQIGLVVNIEPKYPATQSSEDLAATRRAEAQMNRQFIEPALLGRYPDELREVFGEAWPEWSAADLEQIRQPIDFVGLNYYTRAVVRHDPAAWPLRATPVRQSQHTHTEMGWEVFPQGLTDTLLWIKDRYEGTPIYITENGATFADPSQALGNRLDDPQRVEYFRTHIRAVHDAMRAGADVRGYFAWSMLDNFEWALGYSKRFGIIHVDYQTQKRTPKASAKFFADVIASNGAVIF
jgi:beta-glucosidase